MRHRASPRKNSSTRRTSTKSRRGVAIGRRFAVCVQDDGYEASLERNKIYVGPADKDARREGDLRVGDESGADYLFSGRRFVAIEVPSRLLF
jgi:hypothetical protein